MPSAAQSASSSSLELLTIYEVSKILGSSLDLEQTLREVLRALSYQLQMHRGRVYLQGEDGALRLVAAQGLPAQLLLFAAGWCCWPSPPACTSARASGRGHATG